jgi:excinuclease ABC subunit A
MSIREANDWFERCPATQRPAERDRRAHPQGNPRAAGFLNDVGLEYLTLSRNSGTLSGGESQRIRLASQIGSGLTGVLYVLDEPSIGLHQRDNDRLLETLKHLRDQGNTVIVVEHDEDAIRDRRLRGRHRPRRRRAWRRDRRAGHAGRDHGQPRLDHRQVPLRVMREIAGAGQAPQAQARARCSRSSAPRGNNLKNVTATSRWASLHLRHRRVGRRQVHLTIETLYKAASRS